MNSHTKTMRAFSSAPFRHLFFARLFTVLGNGIAPIALAFAVLDIGGSAADLGIVVAARSVFNVAFLLVGGVLADRYSRSPRCWFRPRLLRQYRKRLSPPVRAGRQRIGHQPSALLGTLNGAAAGIALPASSALVPQTVPAHNLREANALIQLGIYSGTVVGASLGGILTSAVGLAGAGD